jgi:hypothetical protein
MAQLFITDLGDPSVGIFTQTWIIDTPLSQTDDYEDLNSFKEIMVGLYSDYADGKVIGEYDFENLPDE